MSEITESEPGTTSAAETLPLITLEGAVVFPYTVISLTLNDENFAAAEAALKHGRHLLLAPKRPDAEEGAPLADQLFPVAVVGRIEQSGVLPGGANGIIVRGVVRADLGEQVAEEAYPRFTFKRRPDVFALSPEFEQLIIEVRAVIDAVLDLRPGVTQEIRNFVRSIEDPGHLADNTGYAPDYTFEERLDLLATFDVVERLIKVRAFYRKQLALLEIQTRLRQEVQDSSAKQQREFYLRQQMRAIQKELGEDDTEATELDDLREKLAAANLPEVTRKEADRELSRLSRINGSSPEYQMVRTYLEWLAELPWGKYTGHAIDIAYARQVLDEDHHGLEKIKERLLEYLAVKQRRAELGEDTGRAGREQIEALVEGVVRRVAGVIG
jgi:ATP-dependent Lon protease